MRFIFNAIRAAKLINGLRLSALMRVRYTEEDLKKIRAREALDEVETEALSGRAL